MSVTLVMLDSGKYPIVFESSLPLVILPGYKRWSALDAEKKNCILIEVNLQSSRSAQDQANQAGNAALPANQSPAPGQEDVPRVAPPASQF